MSGKRHTSHAPVPLMEDRIEAEFFAKRCSICDAKNDPDARKCASCRKRFPKPSVTYAQDAGTARPVR